MAVGSRWHGKRARKLNLASLNQSRAISYPAPPAATAATRSDRHPCPGASPAASPPTHQAGTRPPSHISPARCSRRAPP
eukprot:4569708-Prymnesium_polylepis.1